MITKIGSDDAKKEKSGEKYKFSQKNEMFQNHEIENLENDNQIRNANLR